MKPWEHINIDLESNGLMSMMLDYTKMPYRFKPDASLWCVSVRDVETEQSVLLVPKEVLEERAPVQVTEYSAVEPEMEPQINSEDGSHIMVATGNYVETIKLRVFKDELGNVMKSIEERGYDVNLMPTYKESTRVLEEGIKYNSVPKRELTYEMLDKIFANAKEVSGHNIVNFDLPVLKLFGVIDYKVGYPKYPGSNPAPSTMFGREIKITDTLILSKLLNPDIQDKYGRHGIEPWGMRLGFPKVDFHEFDRWSWNMGYYCDNDTLVGTKLVKHLKEEMEGWDWDLAYSQELKCVDLTVGQEHFGFYFDKDLAEWCLTDLEQKLKERADLVEPSFPPKPLNKGELKLYTPPAKQILKNGKPNSFIQKFADKHGATIEERPRVDDEGATDYFFIYGDREFQIPFTEPIEDSLKTNIKDHDQVKSYLLSLDWVPTEWSERDLTKNSQKQVLTADKAIAAIKRYAKDTCESVYLKDRLDFLDVKKPEKLEDELLKKYYKNPQKPLKVITSPKLRVGAQKELCPNLEKIAKDPEFVKAIAEWHTYTHRKNSISGGGMDDEGNPQKGFLSFLREDGRVATPADTMGAASFRYTHKNICNIARASSLYGEFMRALFGAGEGLYQFGFDFASLEARVQAHYIYSYLGGPELGEALLAEKPNDIHTLNAKKLGISRDNAKSITYALLYGAAAPKLQKMLGLSPAEAEKMFNDYWDAVPPLKELRDNLVKYWEKVDRDHIIGIDGRKLRARSPHSLINLLFQSAGAILAKWSVVRIAELLEEQGLLGNPFEHTTDEVKVWQMIVYHDEVQYAVHKSLIKNVSFYNEAVDADYKERLKAWKEAGADKKTKPANPFEEAAEHFIETNKSDDPLEQFSDIGHTDKGIHYVTTPNVVSRTIIKAIDDTVKYHNLKVPLGIAWITGLNWKMCH